MSRHPPRSTRTYTLFPYPTRFRSLVLNYTRRLCRPSFAALNPDRLQFYDFLAQIGNPDLLPEYTDRVEAGITLAGGRSWDVYYATTSNTMAQYAETVDTMIEYQIRSEERRVGKEWVSKCRSRGPPFDVKKKTK